MEMKQATDCKCPFCFQRFSPQKAAFKAMTVFTEQDFSAGINDEAELELKKRYALETDLAYEQFWNQYPGSEPQNEYRDYPVIDNLSDSYVNGKYEADTSGFINRAVDEFGVVTKVRICPYCHNVLPFEFGKYPVKYISVAGITSSGKTVYLSQLLRQIETFFVKAGLTVVGTYDEAERFLDHYKILKDVPLPRGNAADGLMPPLALNVKCNKTQQVYTLVFYDIAGENCVTPDQMEKFGPFIQNSDGILLMIDPGQFLGNPAREKGTEAERKEAEKEAYSPDRVIAAMWNAFVTSDNTEGKSQIPLAVTLSKSDTQTDVLDYRSALFANISYQEYTDNEIPLKAFAATDMEVRRLLAGLNRTKTEILCNKLNECFPVHAFFAVSALNAMPKEQTGENFENYYLLDEDPETIRVEEPIFWILYKLGILQVKETEQKKKRGGLLRRLFE
ncbi:MAG: hypothetical protein K2N87_16830 [Eubacterium sp.]|nr:hypothetical protein [Eubacterium sp.]